MVYLEQARDIYGAEPKDQGTAGTGTVTATAGGNIGIDRVLAEEIIKKYFYARFLQSLEKIPGGRKTLE